MSDAGAAAGQGQGRRKRGRRRGAGGGGGGGAQPAGGGGGGARRVDLWRPVPSLDPPAPIAPAPDPTALLRSLGDPPLQGQGAVAGHYLAAVVEEAARVATAIAAVSGVLNTSKDED
jgi:hypothetical protein